MTASRLSENRVKVDDGHEEKRTNSSRILVTCTFPKWRSWRLVYHVLLFVVLIAPPGRCARDSNRSTVNKKRTAANVNITYIDNGMTHVLFQKAKELGHFSVNSKIAPESGEVVRVMTIENNTDGCNDLINHIPSRNWIALIQRGNCSFNKKIEIAAKTYNASAVVIYNSKEEKEPVNNNEVELPTGVEDVVTIYIKNEEGQQIVNLLEKKYKVLMHITVGTVTLPKTEDPTFNPHNISKTSVLFVSISFIVLMIISLAWLVFYYIQRFRYAHAKERLTRRLASAAKKAIAKIPQRTVKTGDKELESEFDQCAVCIEGYKASDVIRILPCKHIFHKSCVDPWLLEQRSCPMCKLDILREYGMQVHLNSSQESVHAEVESGAIPSAITDDVEHLPTSSEDHGGAEGMNIVLISHPSLQYHGSDTFCVKDEMSTESTALNPIHSSTSKVSPNVQCVRADIEIDSDDHNSDMDGECNELHSLMTGLPPAKGSKRDSLES
ncbi:RING finger protein 150-like [Ylistrum balloti]|uniref:RING finger protein 150-like n=1 Tax=Ylistrum balloti TaxID=509963 RepID=UPI002905AFE0|nr:RING finger protein 150-like [Ylistrum balloti]